jgi:hypothetical protein
MSHRHYNTLGFPVNTFQPISSLIPNFFNALTAMLYAATKSALC